MKYTYGLCRGRHDIPGVKEYIFHTTLNPLDVDGLVTMANNAIPADADDLTVYATGLTVAMLAVVRVAFARQCNLTVMHYDRETTTYYPQTVLNYERCGFCGKPMSVHDWACPHCGAT